MSLGTIPVRAQTLSGQIKQADADVVECGVMLTRARKQVELAEAAEVKAVANAARLRDEREALRLEASELIGQVGEPLVVAGEEVSTSADAGGDKVAPASCEHSFDYRDFNDDYQCSRCGEIVSVAALQDRGINAVRRVALNG